MRAVVAEGIGKGWTVCDRPDPNPGDNDLLVQVEASSVCHSDIRLAVDPDFGGSFPRIPGHEFVGRITDLGRNVRGWQRGARVGVAWAQRWCGRCKQCLEQSYSFCESGCDITGGTVDGGHAQFAVVDAAAAVALPTESAASQLAPLLCAGYTAYSALKQACVRPGDRVAVIGIGGVGHLALQYARALGATVIAVTRETKQQEALTLGAHEVVSNEPAQLGAALQALGGANVAILTGDGPLGSLVDGLLVGARIAAVSVGPQTLSVPLRTAVFKKLTIIGSSPGSRLLLKEVLDFHIACGAHTYVEELPLDQAPVAYGRVSRGDARYRVVLIP